MIPRNYIHYVFLSAGICKFVYEYRSIVYCGGTVNGQFFSSDTNVISQYLLLPYMVLGRSDSSYFFFTNLFNIKILFESEKKQTNQII
jgi:hypothetical protein